MVHSNRSLELFELSTEALDGIDEVADTVALPRSDHKTLAKEAEEAQSRALLNKKRSRLLGLPEELLTVLLAHLEATELARMSTVCRQLRDMANQPQLWRGLALTTWGPRVEAQPQPSGYRQLFAERPRLRHDGIFVSRHSYIRAGAKEGGTSRPWFEVLYFRVFRFLSDGTCLYANTPEKPSLLAGALHPGNPALHVGTYEIDNDEEDLVRVEVVAPMPAVEAHGQRGKPKRRQHAQDDPQQRGVYRPTHFFTLRISGTKPGRNNRISLESHAYTLTTGGREDNFDHHGTVFQFFTT
jgi:hypothetical protein